MEASTCTGSSNENLYRFAAREDAALLHEKRFPAPEHFECDQYGSKARYLTQKLNPDVPLSSFMQGLYKATVSGRD